MPIDEHFFKILYKGTRWEMQLNFKFEEHGSHGNFQISFLICFQVNRKILMQNNLAKRGLVVIICLVKFLETLLQNHLTTIINFVRIQFTNKDTRKFVMMSPAGKIDIVWLNNLKRVRYNLNLNFVISMFKFYCEDVN